MVLLHKVQDRNKETKGLFSALNYSAHHMWLELRVRVITRQRKLEKLLKHLFSWRLGSLASRWLSWHFAGESIVHNDLTVELRVNENIHSQSLFTAALNFKKKKKKISDAVERDYRRSLPVRPFK